MSDFNEKRVLITGGAKGVGKAIAERFGQSGAQVIINYFHSHDQAKETRKELEACGINVYLIRASVAKKHQVERMFREIEEKFGGIDILVNNAADGALVPLEDVTEEQLDRAVDTNLKGSLWCARHAAALMKKHGGGVIVNVSSLGAQHPLDNYLVVGPTKAAIESLTRYLAAEYGSYNIRVNTASAGLLDTDVIRHFPDYERMCEEWRQATPLGRIGHAEDLADVVLFLASDQARWITGQTILADGGMSLSGLPKSHPSKDTPFFFKQSKVKISSRPGLENESDAIAIVGMGLIVPGAASPEEFWTLLCEGSDLVTATPEERWNWRHFVSQDPSAADKSYSQYGLYITNDAVTENVSDDSSITWLHHAIKQAVSGVTLSRNSRYASIVGYTADGSQALEESFVLRHCLRRLTKSIARNAIPEDAAGLIEEAGRILSRRYHRGTQPPHMFLPHRLAHDAIRGILPGKTHAIVVDTACSASLYSAILGIQMLHNNTCDTAVCSGVMTLGPLNGALFSQLKGLSRSGRIRPFDRDDDGVLFGEGAGAVVLKRLEQARRDGDTILGIIDACGGSSDGKGKAVSAPNTAGQQRTLQRTWEQNPAAAENIEWILAHATGTPVGDRSELRVLNTLPGITSPVYLSANKALIGHTAWVAGVMSIIQACLGLQHERIPPQFKFSAFPDIDEFNAQRFVVPRKEVPWPPKEDRARTAAVNGFGFGGINAHLLISDKPDFCKNGTSLKEDESHIALVGWSACLPGLTSRAQVSAWLSGKGPGPDRSFAPEHVMQACSRYRIPPKTLRTIDPAQVLALDCAQELKEAMGNTWDSMKDTTGVFFGHMGKTRHGILYGSRCYLDDACETIQTGTQFSRCPEKDRIIEEFRKEIQEAIPQANEDSFPGIMPNIIPARMANYFDLKGPTMVLDTGFTSGITAHEIACRYLRSREIDFAVVGGGSAASIPEIKDMVNAIGSEDGLVPGEGLFMYALMRERDAVEQDIPVLCITDDAFGKTKEKHFDGYRVSCGYGKQPDGTYTYLGGEGSLGVLRALHSGTAQAQVACSSECDVPEGNITLIRIDQSRYSAAADANGPRVIIQAEEIEMQAQRQTVELLPIPREPAGERIPFIQPGTVIITDSVCTVADFENIFEGCIILYPGQTDDTPEWAIGLKEITPAVVSAVLESQAGRYRHVRVLAGLGGMDTGIEQQEEYMAVHDLVFLVAQHMYETMQNMNGTCMGAFTGAIDDGIPRPVTGLFAGLINDLGCELESGGTCLAVFTDETDPLAAARWAEEESTLRRILSSVVIDNGVRKTWLPREHEPNDAEDFAAILNSKSIVVVTGGGRGLTSEITRALARTVRPKIYVLGSTDIAAYSAEIFSGTDEEFETSKPAFIRERSAETPGRPVRDIVNDFYRQWKARQAYRTINDLKNICGDDRVTYCACDILDSEHVTETMRVILEQEGHIDLLVNGAGVDRSQSLPMKQFDDFQYVRDLKFRGYLNLKNALKESPPRIWCNFGSMVSTLVVMPGQADYLSGNMYLNTAAHYAAVRQGTDEFTIGWTLWNETGMIRAPYNKSVAHVIRDAGFLTEMTSKEGIRHFMRELFQPAHTPVVLFIGETEKRKSGEAYNANDPFTRALYPQLIPPAILPGNRTAGKLGFYLDRVLEQSENAALFEREFDLEKDAYLKDHVVNGYPTLPGTFVPEIGAEAAYFLAPGMTVTAIENITFKHYLRVYSPEKPTMVRIQAKIKEKSENCMRVAVRILSDVISPGGIVLKRDREHFSLEVLLGLEQPDMRGSLYSTEGSPAPVIDPYHADESPVSLSGMFVSTADTGCTPMGKYGRYTAPVPPGHPVFGSFTLPVFLLDGLARLLALSPSKYLPVFAPGHIRNIELFTTRNDACLAEHTEKIDLHAYGYGASPEQQLSENSVCEATDDSGKVLLRITGLTGIITGFIHTETGKLLMPGQVPKNNEQKPPGIEQQDDDTLEFLARQYETSVQSGIQQEHAATFEEHIARLTRPLQDARRTGVYFYEQEISEYHGAWITCNGRRMLMMASYSYLDLLGHPAITAVATEALRKYGAGTHGARLLAGTTSLHHDLEQTIARFKHAEDAIVYSSGYLTNLATIDALVGEGDWVISDMLNHSSIVDGARFSRARFVQYGHNNMQSLEQRLIHCRTGRKLVIADAVFSMDGDIADLPNLVDICRKHDALLMIDEAHSTGVLGTTGHGIFEHFGIEPGEGVLKMGTLSKAIASVGGYVAGSKELVFALKNHARGFVFSAALPPPQTAAAMAAFTVIEREPERVERLQHNARILREGLKACGFNTLNSVTPVIPVICNNIVKTVKMTLACKAAGIFVIPVMFPAVPLESPRLRVTVTTAHSDDDIQFAMDAFERAGRESGVLPSRARIVTVPDIKNGKS
jgi:8-amino-7-oxononanoate synthase